MHANTELRIGGTPTPQGIRDTGDTSEGRGKSFERAAQTDAAVEAARQCRRKSAYGQSCPRVCKLCGNCRGAGGAAKQP